MVLRIQFPQSFAFELGWSFFFLCLGVLQPLLGSTAKEAPDGVFFIPPHNIPRKKDKRKKKTLLAQGRYYPITKVQYQNLVRDPTADNDKKSLEAPFGTY